MCPLQMVWITATATSHPEPSTRWTPNPGMCPAMWPECQLGGWQTQILFGLPAVCERESGNPKPETLDVAWLVPESLPVQEVKKTPHLPCASTMKAARAAVSPSVECKAPGHGPLRGLLLSPVVLRDSGCSFSLNPQALSGSFLKFLLPESIWEAYGLICKAEGLLAVSVFSESGCGQPSFSGDLGCENALSCCQRSVLPDAAELVAVQSCLGHVQVPPAADREERWVNPTP